MSSVATTNATVSASGVVTYEYDGVIRAQVGSAIPTSTLTGLLSSAQIAELEAVKITGTITETQIGPEAVSTPKLKAGSVVTSKLAAGSVIAEKIAVAELSAITANLGTVTAGIIQGPTIRTGTVGARVSLTSSGLQAFNGGGEEVLNFSTSSGNLFIKGEVKAGSIVPATTITGLLTSAQIAELAAAKLTGTIVESQVAPEAISTPKLKAGAVVTAKLAAGAVTAEKIAVGELSAISANLGTVTAGILKAVVIEGGTGSFEGEVKALSLTLPSGTGFAPATKDILRWLDPESGESNAFIYGNRNGIEKQLVLGPRASTTTGARVTLTDQRPENSKINAGISTLKAGLGIEDNNAGHSFITAQCNAVTKLILSDEGSSDFLQLAAGGKRLALSGAVNSAGTKLNGSGFTVTRTSAGNYTIKLSAALSSAASLFVEVNGPFTQIHKASGPSTSEWTIVINGFSGLGGGSVTLVATDEAFSFFVIQH